MMTKFYPLAVFTAFIFLMLSCETDLPIAPYRETPVAYCLLNIKDSVHYVRVDRGFLTGQNAFNYTQNIDSISYPPENLLVTLEEYTDQGMHNLLRTIPFTYTPNISKDTGLFSNARNDVYKSSEKLDNTMTKYYRLRIKDKLTGHEASAVSRLLGHWDIDREFNDKRTLKRNIYVIEPLDYEGSLFYYDYDERTYRFLYKEINPATSDTVKKYIDWQVYVGKKKSTALDSLQYNDDFFKMLQENIPADPDLLRIAVGVDKMVTLTNPELDTYIYNFNHPYDPHYNPSYTNFENGLGIFSSRYFYCFHAQQFTIRTLDSIRSGRYTKNLNFL